MPTVRPVALAILSHERKGIDMLVDISESAIKAMRRIAAGDRIVLERAGPDNVLDTGTARHDSGRSLGATAEAASAVFVQLLTAKLITPTYVRKDSSREYYTLTEMGRSWLEHKDRD